jgi:hypothetical protein
MMQSRRSEYPSVSSGRKMADLVGRWWGEWECVEKELSLVE